MHDFRNKMLGLKIKEKYQICNRHLLKAKTRKQIEDKTNIGYSYPIYKYHLGTPIVARRSSATVLGATFLGKAYAVGEIARRIPLRSNGPFASVNIAGAKWDKDLHVACHRGKTGQTTDLF